MILAHLSGLPPLFLTVCVCVCLRDWNECELDSLMKMRNNSMKLGNSRWKYHRKTPSFRKTWNEMLNFAFVLSFWTRLLDVREQEWCLEQSQNLGSSESSKSSMTLWNNVELNWGEKCSDNGRCVSSMSMRGCQNSKAPMNCADCASDEGIFGNLTKNETSKHCNSSWVSRRTQTEMFASLWPSRKPSKRVTTKCILTFWQSTTLMQ